MKRLNRKGFTLIELLAVVIILAIIVVVTVPTIINTISDARTQSIWNLAGSVARSYENMAAQDLLASNPTLQGAAIATNTWTCFNQRGNLAEILELSETDVKLDGTVPLADAGGELDLTKITSTSSCSAIRVKANGTAEVLLVAADGGRFQLNGKYVYALSSADGAGSNNAS